MKKYLNYLVIISLLVICECQENALTPKSPSSLTTKSIELVVVGKTDPNADYRSWRGQFIVQSLLRRQYDRNIRPGASTDKPVFVTTSLKVASLSAVKEALMEFRAQFRFKQQWHDERLMFNDTYFKPTDVLHVAEFGKLWIPDTFFQNEKDGRYHTVDQKNVYVKIRPDGRVIYDRRLSMTFACRMNLIRYPMDSQECVIDFASYAYTTDDIIYVWDDPQPIKLLPKADSVLSNFVVTYYANSSCTSKTQTGDDDVTRIPDWWRSVPVLAIGTYSCLRVEFKLQRVFSFFLLQLYVPSCLLVAVSWVSYWIDWRAAAGRVPLAIVTLLTMITQSHAINANLPPVSYAKAIDIWIGACVMFIFGSLIEYAFVNYTGIHDQRKKAELEEQRLQHAATASSIQQSSVMVLPPPPSPCTARQVHEPPLWQKMTPTGQQPELALSPSPMSETVSLIRRRSIGQGRIAGSVRRRPSPAYIPWVLNDQITVDQECSISAQRQQDTIPLNGFRTDLAVHFEDISDRMRLKRRRRILHVPHLCRILQKRSRADRIDYISRLLFPLLFCLFNIVYWSVYWFEFTS